MSETLQTAISRFGTSAKAKLSNPAAEGQPEDQLRAPLERLFKDFAEICGIKDIEAVGESSLADLKTRPDYAVTVQNLLVGFVEVKAPDKGADPTKFNKKGHDYEQWLRLKSLPNLLYTSGNEFSLWRNGERVGDIIRLDGDVETSGSKLEAPEALIGLVESFFRWEPIPPRSASELAKVSARLCRLLRDEVTEQLALENESLTGLAKDWRGLLFPEADNEQFADGYAQAVTFGLLMARARKIELNKGLDQAAKQLGQSNSLIGAALRLLTEDSTSNATLTTSLRTLTRVMDSVDWQKVSKGDPEAWLYFYEDFLDVYDRKLRKETGSYYTPPEVVNAMVRLVDDVLRLRFEQTKGMASPAVTIADPCVGTGTFILGVLRQIAANVQKDEGAGAIEGAIEAAIARLIAFEMQLGPFAVAQLRVQAELLDLIGKAPKKQARMFVTDTLGNPYVELEGLGSWYAPIGESRRQANKIKIEEKITVVIGNPPYKVAAMGEGGWIETGDFHRGMAAPLSDWMPPTEWNVGTHAKHLRNPYVYFWRWATWKVFDHGPKSHTGVVCFITVAGFLNGPGFQKMRDYLRRKCDDIWVIDCSPEGYQPDVPTRIFQGVQQPVCIVLASRSKETESKTPAKVKYAALPEGKREVKFEALKTFSLKGKSWQNCPSQWRAPFLPAAKGAWATYPMLDQLFNYDGSGTMPGRTWIIAPDAESLNDRWKALVKAKPEAKELLFHAHFRNGEPGDKHVNKKAKNLPGFPENTKTVAQEKGDCVTPILYGFRSFDRQWIIPDSRLINQPNPELWKSRSEKQVYLTALMAHSPKSGPALSFTGLVPDLHHYKGSFGGRTFPLWRDAKGKTSNIPEGLLELVGKKLNTTVTAEDMLAYIAAVAAHPGYLAKFESDLVQPGLRIPITADKKTFSDAVRVGKKVIWLHTFGDRFSDAKAGRAAGAPRMPKEKAPTIPKAGKISTDPALMPNEISYELANKRLIIGDGYVNNVSPEVWNYEVGGTNVLQHWFSYRRFDRSRPSPGEKKREPSKLGNIQASGWLAEYTTELINVLNVLELLVELESEQAKLLDKICEGETIPESEIPARVIEKKPKKKKDMKGQKKFLDDDEDE